MKSVSLLPIAALLVSCTHYEPVGVSITVVSDILKEAFLFRIPNPAEPDPDTFQPVTRLKPGEQTRAAPGHYFLASECSGYAFELKSGEPRRIVTSRVSLIRSPVPDGKLDPDEPLLLECNDAIDGHRMRWTDRTEFPVFPGEASFLLAKKLFTVHSPENTPTTHTIPLSPVVLTGGEVQSNDKFFILPEDKPATGDSFVISAHAGKRIWLPSGVFTLEINGTKRKISVEKNTQNEILAGILRIEMPPAFSPEARAAAGGQPIFAYIGEGVLFNLNTDYLVLPGEYVIKIEGSEIQKNIVVEPHKRTVIPTRAAKIDAPPCPADTTCRTPSKITIHKEQRPFPLLSVDPGVPFLVFDENYEYGIDGTRGIYRSLVTGTTELHKETLARARIQWEVRPATGRTRTDLVRVESRAGGNFGRTLDLLFSKPDEILVPPGSWTLSYFVGDPSLERQKTRTEVALEPGQTRTVVIPLYTDKATRAKETLEPSGKNNEPKGQAVLPKSLEPLRR